MIIFLIIMSVGVWVQSWIALMSSSVTGAWAEGVYFQAKVYTLACLLLAWVIS